MEAQGIGEHPGLILPKEAAAALRESELLPARCAARIRQGILALGTLDPRSLSFFRILLGSLILLDVALRFLDLRAFYTDFGVLPRSVVIERHNPAEHFSLLMGSGAAWFQAAALLCAAISGACLALGYRTRLAALAAWILLVSIQHRNPLILQGGDVLFRIMVLFSAVLPVSRVWALDAVAGRTLSLRPSLLHFAYVAQVACVYIITGVAKYKQAGWREGSGLAYALWLQQYTTWLGDLLGKLPVSWLHAANHGVLAVEVLLPLLLFLPWRVPLMRMACFAAFVAFHVAVLVTLKVGLFSLISVVAWIPLLPAEFWCWLSRHSKSPSTEALLHPTSEESGRKELGWRALMPNLLGAVLLSFLVLWNSTNVFSSLRPTLVPPALRQAALLFGVDQSWEMFSRPISSDGWIIIPAVRADGSMADLFSGEEYSGPKRPQSLSAAFLGDRWRKYWRNLLGTGKDYQRLGLGRYFCRRSIEQDAPERRIEALQIIFMREEIQPDGSHASPAKVLLWSHECRAGLLRKWEKKLPFSSLPFPKG